MLRLLPVYNLSFIGSTYKITKFVCLNTPICLDHINNFYFYTPTDLIFACLWMHLSGNHLKKSVKWLTFRDQDKIFKLNFLRSQYFFGFYSAPINSLVSEKIVVFFSLNKKKKSVKFLTVGEGGGQK